MATTPDTTARTRTRTAPDLMGSAVAADALVVELLEHADHLHRQAAREQLGGNRVTMARERTMRLHARQIAEVHDLDVDVSYRESEHDATRGGGE